MRYPYQVRTIQVGVSLYVIFSCFVINKDSQPLNSQRIGLDSGQ